MPFGLAHCGRYRSSGCYEDEIASFQTKVTVLETGAGHVLKCMTKIPEYMTGTLSIIWHRGTVKIGEMTTQSGSIINYEEVKSIQYV